MLSDLGEILHKISSARNDFEHVGFVQIAAAEAEFFVLVYVK